MYTIIYERLIQGTLPERFQSLSLKSGRVIGIVRQGVKDLFEKLLCTVRQGVRDLFGKFLCTVRQGLLECQQVDWVVREGDYDLSGRMTGFSQLNLESKTIFTHNDWVWRKKLSSIFLTKNLQNTAGVLNSSELKH